MYIFAHFWMKKKKNLMFHVQCAVTAGADFKDDKSVYCRQHAQRYAAKEDVGDLELDR